MVAIPKPPRTPQLSPAADFHPAPSPETCARGRDPRHGQRMSRARVLLLNSALGPLDYRVPREMAVEPLAAPEADRRRIRAPEYDPLILERMKLGD